MAFHCNYSGKSPFRNTFFKRFLSWLLEGFASDLFLSYFSGGSVYNVYAEEDEEAEGIAMGQQALENSITMTKMKLLKAKMENMNLSKKVGWTTPTSSTNHKGLSNLAQISLCPHWIYRF